MARGHLREREVVAAAAATVLRFFVQAHGRLHPIDFDGQIGTKPPKSDAIVQVESMPAWRDAHVVREGAAIAVEASTLLGPTAEVQRALARVGMDRGVDIPTDVRVLVGKSRRARMNPDLQAHGKACRCPSSCPIVH